MSTLKRLNVPDGKARVLLVDDHPIVRQGLAALINEQADLAVCGEAGDTQDAIAMAAAVKPHVALIDVSLGSCDGIDLIKELRGQHPELVVLVLSMHDESVYAERALRAGALGYVMKNEPAEKLMAAIRRVLGGEIYVSERFASRLLQRMAGSRAVTEVSPIERLSDRELQVFRCIGQGMGVREIAEKLYLSVKTIEAHREHIKQKLSLHSSNELLRYAVQYTVLEQ
ncbi:MAG TPA: response regulator transcription factor [Tepidisphaeraceae bacterium]|nr:response regulator transcription factor [Tepidisphaeraceae bacterium]